MSLCCSQRSFSVPFFCPSVFVCESDLLFSFSCLHTDRWLQSDSCLFCLFFVCLKEIKKRKELKKNTITVLYNCDAAFGRTTCCTDNNTSQIDLLWSTVICSREYVQLAGPFTLKFDSSIGATREHKEMHPGTDYTLMADWMSDTGNIWL